MSENLYFYQCTIDSAHSPKLQMERARRMASTTRSRKSKSIRRFIWSVGMSMHSCSSNSARQDSTNKLHILCPRCVSLASSRVWPCFSGCAVLSNVLFIRK